MEQYVNAGKGKTVKIEMIGFEQAYEWRTDITNSRDISLENMNISDLGTPGIIK